MLQCNIQSGRAYSRTWIGRSVPALAEGTEQVSTKRNPASPRSVVFRRFSRQKHVNGSNRNLGANLDHTPRRDVEEVGGVARGFRQGDEQSVLPARHAGMGSWLERAARQEERG